MLKSMRSKSAELRAEDQDIRPSFSIQHSTFSIADCSRLIQCRQRNSIRVHAPSHHRCSSSSPQCPVTSGGAAEPGLPRTLESDRHRPGLGSRLLAGSHRDWRQALGHVPQPRRQSRAAGQHRRQRRRARLPAGTRQQQAAGRPVPGQARRRKAGGHDQGRRAHGQFRRRAAAEVAGEQRQRHTQVRHAGRALRRHDCRRLRLPGGHLPHHVEGRRRRAHQRTADAQPRLEAEVLELPAPGRVQARRQEQQRHLSPRPLRDAGPR